MSNPSLHTRSSQISSQPDPRTLEYTEETTIKTTTRTARLKGFLTRKSKKSLNHSNSASSTGSGKLFEVSDEMAPGNSLHQLPLTPDASPKTSRQNSSQAVTLDPQSDSDFDIASDHYDDQGQRVSWNRSTFKNEAQMNGNQVQQTIIGAGDLPTPMQSRNNSLRESESQAGPVRNAEGNALALVQLVERNITPATPGHIPHTKIPKNGIRKHKSSEKDAHDYDNVTADGESRQINGNVFGKNFGDSSSSSSNGGPRHNYQNVHSKGKSRQMNGNVDTDAVQVFWDN